VTLVWLILPTAGVILLIALVLAATAVPWLTARLARRVEAGHATVRGELTAAVVDLARGAPELVAYGTAEAQLERTRAIDRRLGKIARRTGRTAGIGQGLATLLPGLAMVGALVVGLRAVHAGQLDVVLLAVLAVVPLAAFELATGLPAATQTLQRVRHSLARTRQVLDAAPLIVEPPDPMPLPDPPYTVRVRGLRVRYGDEGPWALDGVDLDLSAGRRVAVVGRSGAGKSTLAQVLLRFVPYQSGSVSVNGTEISELRGDDCRRVVGLLAQDAHVFNTTVEANLRLARRDATAAEIERALTDARLVEWVHQLPAGLGTEVGEFGGKISGGERQRLAAARVLLAGFPVLVLDEPGEHLDTATADALVADVLGAAKTHAILLITHRLAGLESVDEVIVLDDGRVRERGAHAELLARGGAYAEMWRRERETR
jgi:thiol reductant ABC exporter CydC subunit